MNIPKKYAPKAKTNNPHIQMFGYVNENRICKKSTKIGAIKKEPNIRGNKNL